MTNRSLHGLVAIALVALAAHPSHAAWRLDLAHVNDVGIGSDVEDDLYTAVLGVAVSTRRYRFSFEENMFTDRRNDVRFDETHVTVSRSLRPVDGWEMTAGLGVVRVGEGLLGESFQNWIHRLVRTSEVHITYLDGTSLHASARFEALRPFVAGDDVTVGPWLEAYAAFDFKHHALAGAAVEWRATPRVSLSGRAAARYTGTELPELDRWVDGWAPAASLGLQITRWVNVAYLYNPYGTEQHHVRVNVSVSFD